MSVKVSDIDNKIILQLWELSSSPYTSEVKSDKTAFAQNRIFFLIINTSTTIPHFLSFSQQQLFI